MTKRIAGLVLSACLCLSLTTGCIGGMALSGRVQKFNLVNSIEFHTGTNPVSGKPRVAQVGETRRIAAANGTVSVSTLREDGSIDLAITEPGGVTHFVNLGERGERVIARDIDGHEIASVARGADLERSARTPN